MVDDPYRFCPILEYASVVWDGCTLSEKQSLEQLQYEAARIVTGLTRSVSIERLLKEIGWVSLSDRRKIQKLIILYKARNGSLPNYLQDLFPSTVADLTDYPLRNNDNYSTIARRTQLFNVSFIPSSVELWNSLDTVIRNSDSLNIFKSKVKDLYKAPDVPKYFLHGERTLSILHGRLRNQCSNLHNDLFRNHLRDNPYCTCGLNIENAEHYFFKCVHYTNQRIILFNETRAYHPIGTNILLYGSETLSIEDNVIIVEAVHKFIKYSNRFNYDN